ncbi:hypothetical protein OU994_27520 [Pseudoduganella sp. SL102]|uniref:hypothetical protein n=1 Tax=Pseudoduganella sp. SL102 TaxID=2995154 RepID=UPI00248B2DD2|nr:hypothetical protein [Pseudoduganella sp. SL102]WBS01964.1 hypothetical protein OU994_27520 [Pseudoduganella sp. SL102]
MDTTHPDSVPGAEQDDAQEAQDKIDAENIDADYMEASADVGCTTDLVRVAERSAHLIDDDMNETEAEEERNAASEGQAMR